MQTNLEALPIMQPCLMIFVRLKCSSSEGVTEADTVEDLRFDAIFQFLNCKVQVVPYSTKIRMAQFDLRVPFVVFGPKMDQGMALGKTQRLLHLLPSLRIPFMGRLFLLAKTLMKRSTIWLLLRTQFVERNLLLS